MTTELARPPKYKPGQHPNSRANLRPPYKPGTNGHGRVYPLKERLAHALDKPLTPPKKDAPAGDHVVYATLKGAIDLVPVAFKETWERTEGKVPDKTAIVGDIQVRFIIGRGYAQEAPLGISTSKTG